MEAIENIFGEIGPLIFALAGLLALGLTYLGERMPRGYAGSLFVGVSLLFLHGILEAKPEQLELMAHGFRAFAP